MVFFEDGGEGTDGCGSVGGALSHYSGDQVGEWGGKWLIQRQKAGGRRTQTGYFDGCRVQLIVTVDGAINAAWLMQPHVGRYHTGPGPW